MTQKMSVQEQQRPLTFACLELIGLAIGEAQTAGHLLNSPDQLGFDGHAVSDLQLSTDEFFQRFLALKMLFINQKTIV